MSIVPGMYMELQNTWCYDLCYYFVLFECTLYRENKLLYEKALIKWDLSIHTRCSVPFGSERPEMPLNYE